MAVKTITVTEEAYNTLKAMKTIDESFSDAILRIGKRKPLMSFYGILKGKSGEDFENVIMETRKRHRKLQQERVKRITEELK